MIRILFFITHLSKGGAEKVLCNLVNAMDQSKYEITVQTLWKADPEQYLKPGIRYRYCYAVQDKKNIFRSRLEAALGMTYMLYVKDDYDIEIAFLEFGSTKIISRSTNKKATRIAWVHTDLRKLISDQEAFVQKSCAWYDRFHKVVCVSETVKQSFDQLFQNRYPSVVLYNYIDEKRIAELAQTPLPVERPKDKLVLVAVGTLYPPKNYPRLLSSFMRLYRQNNRIELWILGDGEQRSMLENLVNEYQIADSVLFWGYQKNPYPFIRQADVLVCSSNYEGFSTVITEGLILGKPIVTTECSGMRELLGDSEYGIITENEDEAFYEGMKRVVSDAELRKSYAEKALQRGKSISGNQLLKETELFFEDTLVSATNEH